ncbi:kinase-like protein, partial [Acephala macrosclerotiorum]
YYYQTSDNIEDIENYRMGGYHPVALRDTLNGHYNVLHKLGYGGFSTVWLAQDTDKSKYVAIKVIMAEASEEAMKVEETGMGKVGSELAHFGDFVNFPTERFWIDGPNGLHLAVVSPLAGPSLAQLVDATQFGGAEEEYTLGGSMAQRLALQITQAVSFFHNAGIGHGDLTCNNILLELQNLDHLTPDALLKLLGHSQVELIARLDAKRVEPTAPKYAIEPANTMNLLPYWTGNIKIIDFGTVYSLNDPPENLSTPFPSCPPEFLLFDKVGKEADIWALGVLIYKIRAGKELFPEITGGDWEVLTQMEEVLGPIPFQNGIAQPDSLTIDGTRKNGADVGQAKVAVKDIIPSGRISREEADLFIDLLQGALNYDVGERMSADEILRHPWF